MTAPSLPHDIDRIPLNPREPLVVVDVDEVLAMFMRGFERFVGAHGYEMRITRFALFQNIFRIEDGAVLGKQDGDGQIARFQRSFNCSRSISSMMGSSPQASKKLFQSPQSR